MGRVRIGRVLPGAVALLALGVLVVSGAAAAAPTPCNGPLAGTIEGDVSAGFGCDLTAVTLVTGNVKVNPGGSLRIANGSAIQIRGDVHSKNAVFIDVESGSIGGHVKIEGTTGMTTLSNGSVAKNVEIKKSTASIQVNSETIDGDVKVNENTGSIGDAGLIDVSQNTLHHNVDVHKNSLTGTDTNIIQVANGAGFNGSIDGNLDVKDNSLVGGASNLVLVTFNDTGGNTDVHNNTVAGPDDNEILTRDNHVTGNLHVHGNEAFGGATNTIDVSANSAKELDCHGNRPPATGAGNTGKLKGECKNL